MVNQQINRVIFNYRIREIELRANQVSDKEVVNLIGDRPWNVLREIINVANLPFEINDPAECGLWDSYQLTLTHTITKQQIAFIDLSSGEKILISLIFYLYQSQERNVYPKILLLDEPDAHLHPSMTQQFLNVVRDVLVEKFGVQVIMTTHSPSTIVLTPEESIFEMSINNPRITKSISKNKTVSLLTAGLVVVGDGTKYFLVEDEADVNFYWFVNDFLTTNNYISNRISIVFMPGSTREKSGGKNTVRAWVGKLLNTGLSTPIRGLIDRDENNLPSNGVYVLDRYCIENYLIDPIVLYAALMDNGTKSSVLNLKYSMGEEYKLKMLPEIVLQGLADEVFSIVEMPIASLLGEQFSARIPVQFVNGITLMYPNWIITSNGKEILNSIYSTAFGSQIHFGILFKAFKRLSLIPNDITKKLNELQLEEFDSRG